MQQKCTASTQLLESNKLKAKHLRARRGDAADPISAQSSLENITFQSGQSPVTQLLSVETVPPTRPPSMQGSSSDVFNLDVSDGNDIFELGEEGSEGAEKAKGLEHVEREDDSQSQLGVEMTVST
ncbi:hypothetical protein Agabi119p4_11714 [Agaricus bisporus var. burnettii]|uniref:Uncharacterized protein n=1 Tax=Agaricus bisporus var. burnettii TaxID=192524 RepID=A0A8H7BWS4_AGABI|nr:hypothetical protein Agabi119p4_11714 [Agaricus bisporus var. burnettii]